MISKDKRRHLVNLYTPHGFFWRRDKLCYRNGNDIYVNLVPIGNLPHVGTETEVVTLPWTTQQTFDMTFAEVKGGNHCPDVEKAKRVLASGSFGKEVNDVITG